MNCEISGWGNFPVIKSILCMPGSADAVRDYVKNAETVIPRGLGRSYGDSSLNNFVMSMLKLNRILGFDENIGVLECESGVSLNEILDIFVPRGWFLPVMPGTKYVTVGGAIASDVHGKNHHKEGSFSDHVVSMTVLLPDGEIITCSKDSNPGLFAIICGGMGLTGIIISAKFRLKMVTSAYIKQKTVKARNLDEIMDLFESYCNSTYSVAWIDCLAKGDNLGRSILMVGEHAGSDDLKGIDYSNDMLTLRKRKKLNIPVAFPNFVLNNATIKCFNFLYFHKHPSGTLETIVDYETFFCPLDSVTNWNRIYGVRGFTQYQFVIPKAAAKTGLKKIMQKISDSGMGSFLAVLKLFGPGNDNFLSFPMEGYTLAIDFPLSLQLLTFLDELDRMVLDFGGRLYLTKDVRMSCFMAKKSYAGFLEFAERKNQLDNKGKFQSIQSRRLGL